MSSVKHIQVAQMHLHSLLSSSKNDIDISYYIEMYYWIWAYSIYSKGLVYAPVLEQNTWSTYICIFMHTV